MAFTKGKQDAGTQQKGNKRKSSDPRGKASFKKLKTGKTSFVPKGKAGGVSSVDEKAAVKAAAKATGATGVKGAKIKQKVEKKEQLKNAVSKWEKLRRGDTTPEERAELVAGVMKQVEGRVAQTATSPTGSRVLQACIKHCTPAQRQNLLRQIMPQLLELSKGPYSHFLVCRLVSTASKQDLAAIMGVFKGHVPMLLRHPCGAAVIDELFNVVSAQQRNHLAAEFYGKEYTLLSQEAAPAHLSDLLKTVNPPKRRIILQRMAVHLIPIMEKALIDPVLAHRLISEYLEASAPSARLEAIESLTGEALLRMVHTRDGAWVANAVLRYGTAKDCKNSIKAMKGHVLTMAKDKWGSLVLAGALSHVDDTVLLGKVVLPPIKENLGELVEDRHARLAILQLLAPDKARYLQAELLSVVHPEAVASMPAAASKLSAAEASKGSHAEDEDTKEPQEEEGLPKTKEVGARRKDAQLRRKELLGSGEKSLASRLLAEAAEKLEEWLQSETASDMVVELATGGCGGVLLEHHKEAVHSLQEAIASQISSSSDVAESLHGSRALRRMVLASQAQGYETAGKRLADKLWPAFQSCKVTSTGHGKKVAEAFKQRGYK